MADTPSDPVSLVLYSRPDCHLCDEALALVTLTEPLPELDIVDISTDGTLEARYGTRIPVIRLNRSGEELDWPFGPADIRQLLSP